MVTASRSELQRARPRSAVALLLAVSLAACTTPGPQDLPELERRSREQVLEPLPIRAVRPPQPADYAAAQLAAVALAGTREETLAALDAVEREVAADEARARDPFPGTVMLGISDPADELLPLAIDLSNATLDDNAAYREASRQLLGREDMNPALRARLETAVADDPLALADARISDHRESLWAFAFNSASRPLGRTMITGGAIAPYAIAQIVVNFLAGLYERPTSSLQERQALVHWKRYLAEYPDAPDSDGIRERVAQEQSELHTHLHWVSLRSARNALAQHRPGAALFQAERALSYRPDDSTAQKVAASARERQSRLERLRAASLEAPALLEAASPEELALTRALLVFPEAIGRSALPLLRAPADRPELQALSDEAGLAVSMALLERGFEDASFDRLEAVARGNPERSTAARHAATIVANPWQHPYGTFVVLRKRADRRLAAHILLGPWARGPRYRALPRELAYLIDAPGIFQTLITAPVRLLTEAFTPQPNFKRPAAVSGYRYIALHPSGEHTREMLEWLLDFERDRRNPAGALRLADFIPSFDLDERRELAEEVASFQLVGAERVARRDQRSALLRSIVREFPETQAGKQAGLLERYHAIDATPQSIRMSRGFLRENPMVAGREGIGLKRELLDGDPRNGELHPHGVTFLGGRRLEIALVGPSGDDEAPPLLVERDVSEERLSRTIAVLEESLLLSSKLDSGDSQAFDAQRDLYFERARLGLTEEVDNRPTAQSDYVFLGLRDRYGIVRGRESILPFDLVLRGSFSDLSLGAFPRWREPRRTPDAFLYR